MQSHYHPDGVLDGIGYTGDDQLMGLGGKGVFDRRPSLYVLLLLAPLALVSCGREPGEPLQDTEAPEPAPSVAASQPTAAAPPADDVAVWQYPETRTLGDHRVVLHAPQIRRWDGFAHFEGIMALEFYPESRESSPLYVTIKLAGDTDISLEERQVVITEPRIEDVRFVSGGTDDYAAALYAGVRSKTLEVPLDLFLASVDESLLAGGARQGFNTAPPPIHVSFSPAILLHIAGGPYPAPLENTGLQIIVNANWPLIGDLQTGAWYLLYRDLWLSSPSLDGDWAATRELPAGLSRLSTEGQHVDLLAAVPAPNSAVPVPRVLYTTEPAELIVVQGEPVLEAVIESGELQYVSNAWAPLFELSGRWFYPVAGRWFVSDSLRAEADWEYVQALPSEFADIPQDHPLAYLRSTVAGTPEARVAALEAILPRQKTLARDAVPPVTVVYDGEPEFKRIEGTPVLRAVNSPQHVLLLDGVYYLCFEGAWYSASLPRGPWAVTDDVAEAVYSIPPESPSYAVTDVEVVDSTTDGVTYTSSAASQTNVYVQNGVPVYSTGWRYAVYFGSYYYPRYPSYGYGRFYNPETGAYGSRSVWYGPYGGYSYGRGYNPSTGRYGYRETAWNGDEFASYSEVYNEKRNTKTTTERYVDDDSGKAYLDRTVEREDEWITTDRTINYDDGWSETERETSRGGSSEMSRSWDEDGNLTSSGSITTGDGRTGEVTGSFTDGEGSATIEGSEGGGGTVERSVDGDTVTREGEFTNADGDTIDSTTKRDGNTRVTEIESSGGGELKSVSEGRNRTTVGKTEDGDIYAGHNGDVYKKTEDGWESYDRDSGEWESSDKQPPADAPQARSDSTVNQSSSQARQAGTAAAPERTRPSPDYGQMERDAAARNQGFQRFQARRSAGRPRGGRRGRR